MIKPFKEQEDQLREWLKLVVRSVQKLNQKYINSVVKKALSEDLYPRGDITTNLINSKNKIIKAKIISKQDGIISGLNFAKRLLNLLEKKQFLYLR